MEATADLEREALDLEIEATLGLLRELQWLFLLQQEREARL